MVCHHDDSSPRFLNPGPGRVVFWVVALPNSMNIYHMFMKCSPFPETRSRYGAKAGLKLLVLLPATVYHAQHLMLPFRARPAFSASSGLTIRYEVLPSDTFLSFSLLPANWKEVLLKHISPDQLPVEYGGTMTDPDGNPKCKSKVWATSWMSMGRVLARMCTPAHPVLCF